MAEPVKSQMTSALSALPSKRNPLREKIKAVPRKVAFPSTEPDQDRPLAFSESLDISVHAAIIRATGGLASGGLATAYFDWAIHLAMSPGRLIKLSAKAIEKVLRLATYACHCATRNDAKTCIEPLPQDRRFVGDAWPKWPFNLMYQSFLLNQ